MRKINQASKSWFGSLNMTKIHERPGPWTPRPLDPICLELCSIISCKSFPNDITLIQFIIYLFIAWWQLSSSSERLHITKRICSTVCTSRTKTGRFITQRRVVFVLTVRCLAWAMFVLFCWETEIILWFLSYKNKHNIWELEGPPPLWKAENYTIIIKRMPFGI